MSLIPFRTKRSNGQESSGLPALADFRQEMNRLLDEFFRRGPLAMQPFFDTAESSAWVPAVDISETDTAITIRAELPGLSPEDVDVSVSEDRVVIAGEKKSASESTRNGWTHRECRSGSFTRSIPLPEPIDPDRVTARYEHGVLAVEMAKSEAGTSRRVPVQAA
jgi:HSP20 family protein